jgi:hypothetical protein
LSVFHFVSSNIEINPKRLKAIIGIPNTSITLSAEDQMLSVAAVLTELKSIKEVYMRIGTPCVKALNPIANCAT